MTTSIHPIQRHILLNKDKVTIEIRYDTIGAWLDGYEITTSVETLLRKKLITGLAPNKIQITRAGTLALTREANPVPRPATIPPKSRRSLSSVGSPADPKPSNS